MIFKKIIIILVAITMSFIVVNIDFDKIFKDKKIAKKRYLKFVEITGIKNKKINKVFEKIEKQNLENIYIILKNDNDEDNLKSVMNFANENEEINKILEYISINKLDIYLKMEVINEIKKF